MIKLIFIFFSIIKITFSLVAEWGQCDGINYTGDKNCATGLICVYMDQWFSQCQKPSGTTQQFLVSTTKPSNTVQPPTISNNGTFSVRSNKIFDANGNEFIIRGVNNAHADWDNWSRFWALKSLPKIAEYKSNTVRVQWRMNPFNNDLDLTHLENIIVSCINNNLIAMIQLHDITGDNDPNKLKLCAKWFADNIELFKKYQRYVMINIANEWTQFGYPADQWSKAYISAIDIIRTSGWKGIIVVDAPAYAQDPYAVISHGTEILNHDKANNKNGNVVFSVHTYVQWKKNNGDYKFRRELTRIHDIGLAIIIGEFADQHPEHPTCRWVEIDYLELMTVCKERGIGYLGWSWAGNGYDCNQDLSPLNLVKGDQQIANTWTNGVLSDWGVKLFKTPVVGIEATSKKATVF